MDPSQHAAPAGWPQGMNSDDVHGTASMRKNLIGATFGASSQHTTPAGGFIPAPPSPDPEILHRPQHRYKVPMLHWADGERPPTPPLHYHDDAPQDQHQWDASLSIRGPSGYAPLLETQANYTSLYGAYTPAHDHLPGQPNFQSAPSRQNTIQPPRLHPSANLLRSSPQQQTTRPDSTPIIPSIQQWPTHNLKVDAKTKKKQEAYKRKGEAVRRKTISSQNSAPQYAPIPEPASTPRRKRKARILDDLVMPTPPPPLRRLHPAYGHHYHPVLEQPPFYDMNWTSHGPCHTLPPSSYYPQYEGVSDTRLALNPPQHPPYTPTPLPPSSPKVIDPETIPQHITNNYDEYRWPVKLYQLQAQKGYDFAQCFLETYCQRNIYDSEEHKWHTHTTKGFIKEGNRLSILVLHNAANPFEWGVPPVSTTSIGVYGFYAHEHKEIHWTTIAPSISEWFNLCLDQGFLNVKQKWHPDMKALDKRFHRAYWLAANMFPLKSLLNSSLIPEKPYGSLEDCEGDEFTIAEKDLQHEWIGETVSVEVSEKTWQKLVEQVDELNFGSFDPEHLATGGSERAFMVD